MSALRALWRSSTLASSVWLPSGSAAVRGAVTVTASRLPTAAGSAGGSCAQAHKGNAAAMAPNANGTVV